MCSVVALLRPGHAWPVLIAANRDEKLDRAWDAPGPHWPGLIGGRDRSGGGSWMAMGGHGVVAAILNRPGSLGPEAGKRSRGELPLIAAAAPSAEQGVGRIMALPAREWRPFNMVVADSGAAFFLRGLGAGAPEAMRLEAGVSMVTAHEPNDLESPRIRRHLPRFRATPPPEPDRQDWAGWEALLADRSQGEAGLAEALCVPPVQGFGTVCASLVGLGAAGARLWRFCPHPPGTAPFADLTL